MTNTIMQLQHRELMFCLLKAFKMNFRLGFQHGLSLKHISCYCDARFSDCKMNMIRKGLEKGINTVQALEYAQPDISEDSLYHAIKAAEKTVRKRSHKKRGIELSL